jgi:phage-related minor tail protein
MNDWNRQLVILPGQIAASIMQGFAQAGPFGGIAGIAISAATGAVQLAALLAAVPKKPKPFALGGVFGGGIVDKPTRFKFAQGGTIQDGIMGEKAEEAIVPLERMASGALGVNATTAQNEVRAVSLHDLSKYMVQMINDGQAGAIRSEYVR